MVLLFLVALRDLALLPMLPVVALELPLRRAEEVVVHLERGEPRAGLSGCLTERGPVADDSLTSVPSFVSSAIGPPSLLPERVQVGGDVYVALSDDAPNTESGGDAVAVIDVATRRVIARYPAGSDPEQFAVLPDGSRLYASNEDAGTASAIDLRTSRVIATLVVGTEPEGVGASPDGRWVYVTAETSNTVSVIDARSHHVLRSIELERGEGKPVGVVVSPDGRRVYVANGGTSTVSVIDATTGRVVGRIPVGRRPWGIAISPDGRRLYTANGLSNDVSVIDVAAGQVIATVKVGERPWGVAIVRR